MGLKAFQRIIIKLLLYLIKSDQNGIESKDLKYLFLFDVNDKIRPKWDWKILYQSFGKLDKCR